MRAGQVVTGKILEELKQAHETALKEAQREAAQAEQAERTAAAKATTLWKGEACLRRPVIYNFCSSTTISSSIRRICVCCTAAPSQRHVVLTIVPIN